MALFMASSTEPGKSFAVGRALDKAARNMRAATMLKRAIVKNEVGVS